jgi:hypothetical protein
MLGRSRPGKKYEARFAEETERGPFRLNEKQFKAGEWVAVDQGEADYLRSFGERVELREAH